MSTRKALRSIHLASTVWFILCTSYIFILALREAGFNWLVIFSLSGHWVLLVTMLVSLYLFAIFRGVGKGPGMRKEHPLTSTMYYMALYVSTPFLGALAGAIGMAGETRIGSLAAGVAMGTIGATFLTWVMVDPVTGSLEILAPQPRKHRIHRITQAKIQKQQAQANREQLIIHILEKERENERQWQEALSPQAARLASLLVTRRTDLEQAEQEAIMIGAQAWRTGGLNCMRQLHIMAIDAFKKQYERSECVDYISVWWNGVGTWRNQPSVLV